MCAWIHAYKHCMHQIYETDAQAPILEWYSRPTPANVLVDQLLKT